MAKTIETPLEGKLSHFYPPELKMVRHTPHEPLYNSLLQRYHYLGYRQIVGAHLKYMAFINGQVVVPPQREAPLPGGWPAGINSWST